MRTYFGNEVGDENERRRARGRTPRPTQPAPVIGFSTLLRRPCRPSAASASKPKPMPMQKSWPKKTRQLRAGCIQFFEVSWRIREKHAALRHISPIIICNEMYHRCE